VFRRIFIRRMTIGAAGSFAAIRSASAEDHKTVNYRIKGFTCPTCAVGLEVMLRQQKGVVRAEANYAKANATIDVEPALTSESALRGFITEMGFQADEKV
jgi:cation transport ATPase